MKYVLSLAMKNILRSRRRTILTFMMLTFGVTIYIILSGLYAGIDKVSFDNLVAFDTGHIKARINGFDEERPFSTDNIMPQNELLYEALEKMDFVKGVTKRLNIFAEMDNGTDSAPVVIVGFDTQTDKNVFELNKFISRGEMQAGGAIVGIDLAKDMGLDIGDLFYLTFRDLNGMYVSLEMPVSAILYSGDPKANKMKVFMDLKTLQKEMDTNGVSEITILTDDMYKTGKYAEQIKKAFPEFEINDWKSLSYEFANIVKSKKKAGTFILLVILIIAMVGIINTILISIYEKRREIGTLKAMGMLDTEVRNLFIAEGFIIGLSGSVVGLIIGALVNLYFVYHGIDYSAMVDKMGNMGASMVGVIKSAWAPGDFIMVTILCTLSSIFASYYPARKVMKMQPVECLRTI